MADAGAADKTWTTWNTELELARKTRGYKSWVTRGEKIVKRYRDQRTDEVEYTDTATSAQSARFNILWSNVQTLMPAVFAKRPKPVVERRYLDRDDVGRTAAIIWERALLYELDNGTYFEAVRRAVLDRLLPGRGIVWVRYEPTFRNVPGKTQETKDVGLVGADAAPAAGAGVAGGGGDALDDAGQSMGAAAGAVSEPPEQEKIYECAPVDYLDWKDVLFSPARTFEEVWWGAKRVYLGEAEGKARFPKTWKEITLDWTPAEAKEGQPGVGTPGTPGASKARIWEIWNKRDRKVIWVTEASGTTLEEADDPLHLEGFFPFPKPCSATLTNETMIPVPDYAEYQDQADELDDLTGRIAALTDALKVCGIYDASIPELQRLFQEGKENELIGVDNMAEFMAKAGPSGMGHIWLAPVKDYAEVLLQLYEARERVKQSLYEITGISDIVRGQAGEGGTKTATEQRIKGQFASLRLNDIQSDVARFARDVLRIMGEIIAEHYSDKTLFLVSAYEQYAKEQFLPDVPAGPPPQPPGMGHNGGPPMNGAPSAVPSPPMDAGTGGGIIPPAAAPLPMGLPPEMGAAQKAADLFAKAVALLRNDKLRGFRIDVETDSMIEPDQQATQQGRVEFLTAVGAFLEKAVPMGQMNPKFMPILGKMLLFMARSFKAGRELEGAIEQAVDDLDKQAKNPPPKQPTPEEIKAQTEMAKAKLDAEMQQQQAAIDQQKMQGEMALAQQKAQMDLEVERAKLDMDRQRLEMEREKMQMELAMQQQQHGQQMEMDKQKNDQTLQLEREKASQGLAVEREKNVMTIDATKQENEANRDFERDKINLPKKSDLIDSMEKQSTQVLKVLEGVLDEAKGLKETTEGLKAALDDVSKEVKSPAEIVRGPDGRVSGIRKGGREMTIKRGPDGRAVGLQ